MELTSIRRELLSPRPAIIQSLGMQESAALQSTSKTYIKLAQSCQSGEDCVIALDTQTSSWGNNSSWQYRVGEQSSPQIEFNLGGDHLQDFGSEEPAEEKTCSAEQNEEAEVDALAEEIANEIRSRHNENSNPNNVEMGAFILRIQNDDGSTSIVRVSNLTSGTTGAVSLREMFNAAQSEFPGIDGSNVVGSVHLHPSGPPGEPPSFDTDGTLTDLDYGNLMPSHPNIAAGPSDWINLRGFLQNRGLANINDLSHYILGPDGVLREFDYEDGHPAEFTEQAERINNAENDAEGECA